MKKLINLLVIGGAVVGSGLTATTHDLSADVAKKALSVDSNLYTSYVNEASSITNTVQMNSDWSSTGYFDFKLGDEFDEALNAIRGFRVTPDTDFVGGAAEEISIDLSATLSTPFYNNVCQTKKKAVYLADWGQREDEKTFGYLDYTCDSYGELEITLDPNGAIYESNYYYIIFNPASRFSGVAESTWLNGQYLSDYVYSRRSKFSYANFKDNGAQVRAVYLYTGYTMPSGAIREATIRVEDMLTVEEIKKLCSASDYFGRDVPLSISNLNDYAPGKIGTFDFTLSARNPNGTTSSATLRIRVTDNTKPTISQKEVLYVPSEEPVGWETLLNNLTYSDNVACSVLTLSGKDGNNRDFNVDLLHERDREEIQLDLAVGTYTFKAEVMDTSGNRSAVIPITVIATDNTPPVIRSDYQSDSHTIGIEFAVSSYVDMILSKYTAVDLIDGECPITFDSSSIRQTVGTYQIVLTAKDSANNTTTKTVSFIVEDNTNIYFEIEKNLFLSTLENPYTRVDIEAIVLKKEQVTRDEVKAIGINDTAYQNASKPGKYAVPYKLEKTNGEEKTDVINFQVIGTEKKENWFTKYIWSPICDFFVKLKNAIVSTFKGEGWKFQLDIDEGDIV